MGPFDRVTLCSASVRPCLCISVAVETVLVVNSMSWLSRGCESLWKFQELEPEEVLGWDLPGVAGW